MRDYGTLAPFTSFLPGLAGTKGIPIWAFYVNRGQGICSFGIDNKSNAILEFDPAYLAYEKVSINGFRTFLRVNGQYIEPFSADNEADTQMRIEENQMHIHTQNLEDSIQTDVSYFVMPNEDYGALVRRVTIRNTGDQELQIEGLDGLPRLIPYGIKNGEYKEMANLLRSWSEVRNVENGAPLFTLRSTTGDSAQVGDVAGGYFALSQVDGVITAPIYDSWAVFGEGQSMDRPRIFSNKGLKGVTDHKQCYTNKLPCAFTPFTAVLPPGGQTRIDTVIGYAASLAWLNTKIPVMSSSAYLDQKQEEAKSLVEELLQDVQTTSAEPLFDRYIRQCYLDNLLRGGYPVPFDAGGSQTVVHLFSRKHGDPERDYNFFSIAAQPYSQGNGNFRDVCQNRRSDVLLHPFAGGHNIRTFLDLIQADGYNPLEVQGMVLRIPTAQQAPLSSILSRLEQPLAQKLEALCTDRFTLGQLVQATGVDSPLIAELLALAEAESNAAFHEGYWVDHWVYLLDLVENTLKLYPDQTNSLLFENAIYRFYNSPARVAPRSQKYVLDDGQPRQYHSVVLDEVKKEQGWKPDAAQWLTTAQGEVYRTGLYAKLFMLATVKFATLDPYGMGIEMEANKPGWNDAMNGLPGLFGSSMGETIELKRLLTFLQQAAIQDQQVTLPCEFTELLTTLQKLIQRRDIAELDAFAYWDACTAAREKYREAVRFTISGEQQSYSVQTLSELCAYMQAMVEQGIQRAMNYGDGLIPTFFTFNAVGFSAVEDADGQPALAPCGLPRMMVHEFSPRALPAFLEGPVKLLSVTQDADQALALHRSVRSSALFDKKLKMYKTCVSLDDEPMSIGRIRAFTPGWQERESVFLHMHYKYLLAMLRGGLYQPFFEEMKTTWLPFRSAETYGRSPLENCSFLASSVNPDPGLHGRGFVTRLSGSTTEVLSMWAEMMVGDVWFAFENGALSFTFAPVLPGWLFDEEGKLTFRLLSACDVTYHNPRRADTFGINAVKVTSITLKYEGTQVTFRGNTLPEQWASLLREGQLDDIVIQLA
ncbi:cellobiose phosphorylase [Paenibacillaceae bacterium]|nr:cellobiose phosphorylase [Paenibacillaceae bacterium]